METGAAAAVVALQAARDAVAAIDVDSLTHAELLEVLEQLDTDSRRTPTVADRVINRLAAEADPLDLGATSLTKALAFHLRIAQTDARRRIDCAADLGPRRTLSGEPMPPGLQKTAAAQEAGRIGADHVAIIRAFFANLPDSVDYETREAAEADLARITGGHGPEGLRRAAHLLAALLHPDGDYTDAERARRRGSLRRRPAHRRGRRTGLTLPRTTQLKRPGAMGRSVLCSGQLGQHNGLPVTIIVSTTLQELESGAGQAITGGGSRLPMQDLIRLAAHAFHYLAVFDKATGEALHLGRSRRCASAAQRIVLIGRDRGCTRPGCIASGYHSQVHHAVADWKNDGRTDVNDLTLACGPDNRMIENTEWTTRKRADGRIEWIPPPILDTGQARVNDLHHPEYLLGDGRDEHTA